MKKIVITISGIFLSLLLFAQQNSEIYYYYLGNKVFPRRTTDKIYLKLAPNTSKEQLLNIISSDVSLQIYDSH